MLQALFGVCDVFFLEDRAVGLIVAINWLMVVAFQDDDKNEKSKKD